MSIITKYEKTDTDFTPITQCEAGTVNAVCCFVFDLGIQKTTYLGAIKWKPQVLLVFEIAQRIEDEGNFKGKRYVQYKYYTNSLFDNSHLRKDLKTWRKRDFTEEELVNGFDLESLIGKPCLLNLVERKYMKDGEEQTVVNIESISAHIKGMEILKSELPKDWMPKKIAEKIEIGKRNLENKLREKKVALPTTPEPMDEEAQINASINSEDGIPDEEIPF